MNMQDTVKKLTPAMAEQEDMIDILDQAKDSPDFSEKILLVMLTHRWHSYAVLQHAVKINKISTYCCSMWKVAHYLISLFKSKS